MALLKVGKGETLELILEQEDDAGNPVPFTDHILKFKLYDEGAPTPRHEATAVVSGTTATFKIDEAVTAQWPANVYIYLIEDSFNGDVKWTDHSRLKVIGPSSLA